MTMIVTKNRITTIGIGFVVFACHDHHRHQSSATDTATALVDLNKHRSFADELTKIIYTNENECSSALGVSMAFSLIYPGCTGDAVDELRNVLGYYPTSDSNTDNMQQLVWADATHRMLGNARGQCPGGESYDGGCNAQAPLLKIANSIWFDEKSTLNPNYAKVVGSYAEQIDLTSDKSPDIVNAWVSQSTNGLIDSIVDSGKPLYPPWEIIAINSIYLKASWKHPFQDYNTNLDTFYDSASRESEVSKAHFMNGVFGGLLYSHDAIPGYQIVRLPFTESQMSMILVLPLSNNNDGDVESISSSELLPVLNKLQSTRVALSLPKFRFESTYDDDLKAAIIQTGITAPFSAGSLCGLLEGDDENDSDACNNSSLYIDKIIQKTVIDVHEIGVEAAAVTAIMMGRGAPMNLPDPVTMVCDHPFQFFIHDGAEDLVIFEGRLGEPKVPEGEPAEPLLDGVHSDGSGFWSKTFSVDVVDPPEFESEAPVADPPEYELEDLVVADPEPKVSSLSSKSSSIRNFFCGKKCFSLIIGALVAVAVGFIL